MIRPDSEFLADITTFPEIHCDQDLFPCPLADWRVHRLAAMSDSPPPITSMQLSKGSEVLGIIS
jgi:hypothetical protein